MIKQRTVKCIYVYVNGLLFFLVFFQGDGLYVDHFFAFVVFFWFVVKDIWIWTLLSYLTSMSL
jgi:hypothetical protein